MSSVPLPDLPPGAPDDAAFEAAKRIAAEGDVPARAALAGQPGTAPELLYYLAGDSALPVRAAVAANPSAPPKVDALLAGDADARVREVLARKIGAMVPGLSSGEAARLRERGWRTLRRLVDDTAVAVRAAVADAVADLPDAPRELILRLARDAEMPVAEPVIRLSPLLTDNDLLALVTEPAASPTLTAVARRPHLSEVVSGAVAATADVTAVAALLENESAAIRESTLDALVAGAAGTMAWQGPLVRRPALPPRAQRALAGFVTEGLLASLATRPDLDPVLLDDLRDRMAGRLVPSQVPSASSTVPAPVTGGGAGEAGFLQACRRGDRAGAAELLAEAANLPRAMVGQAAQLRSAKALVSLCWKAGFGLQAAAAAQVALAGLAPEARLGQTPDGGWPLAPGEMRWQLDALAAASA